MHGLSVICCTARRNPGYGPMIESLWENLQQLHAVYDTPVEFIAVDEGMWHRPKECFDELAERVRGRFTYQHVAPKPTVWRGPHRLTKRDLWAKQSALNTAVCYAKYDRLAFFDDQSTLGDYWLPSHCASHSVSICGTYVYWHPGATVSGTHVEGQKHVPGDHRPLDQDLPGHCNPSWLYGGNVSFPLEAILQCNGWEELLCGSGGLEDSEFSVRIARVTQTYFFPDCVVNYLTDTNEVVGDYLGKTAADVHKVQQNEAPQRCKGFHYKDPNGVVHWFSWNHVPIWRLTGYRLGAHPDSTETSPLGTPIYDPKLEHHRKRVGTLGNHFDLRALRARIQGGGQFPIPTQPTNDWRDNQPLSDMG